MIIGFDSNTVHDIQKKFIPHTKNWTTNVERYISATTSNVQMSPRKTATTSINSVFIYLSPI
jgi:hypothetical protein